MTLTSLVLTLKPREAASAPPHLGRAAHAALLRAVDAAHPALAAQLHDAPPGASGPKPFTCSSLMGKRAEGRLDPNGAYTLRYTALTSELADLLPSLFEGPKPEAGGRKPEVGDPQSEIQNPISAIELDGVLFDVTGATCDPAVQPWAAQTTFEELSAPWLLGRAEPARHITFQFTSPTTFHSGGRSVPLPLPELVLGSLLERWNAYAPVALPEETRRFAAECMAVSRYELTTRSLPFKEGAVKIGMVGQVTFAATRYDRYWLSLIHLLAEFALFAGVGAGVTMGMGQARPLAATHCADADQRR
jgi:CRISPR-associated endoribonuclease Cas6